MFTKAQRSVFGTLLPLGLAVSQASVAVAGHAASGGGTYFVAPGVLSQFQFSPGSLQCKVAQGKDAEGQPTGFQMFMFSTEIDEFAIDDGQGDYVPAAMVEGEMVSVTVLGKGPDREMFSEIVPFSALAEDVANPGGGMDVFTLSVEYDDTKVQGPFFASLDFGSCNNVCTITFAGTLESGNIRVHH